MRVAVEPSNGLVTGGGTFRQRPQSPTQCWRRLADTGPALSPKAQSAAWARCVSVCVSVCAFCMDGLAPNAAPNPDLLSPIGIPAGKWTVRWLRLVGLRCCNSAEVDGAQSVSERCSFQQVLGGW